MKPSFLVIFMLFNCSFLNLYGQVEGDSDCGFTMSLEEEQKLVSHLGMIKIRQLILQTIESFDDIPSGPWRFVPEYIPVDYGSSFHANPFNLTLNGTTYVEDAPYLRSSWEYTIADGTAGAASFDGIKMGDVNGDNLDGFIEGCPDYEITELAPSIPKAADEYAVLHLKTIGFDNVVSFQFDFHFNKNVLELIEIADVNAFLPGFSGDNIAYPTDLNAPELRLSWVDPNLSPKSMAEGGVLLEIVVRAKVPINNISQFFHLDNDILQAEFYDTEGCPIPVQLEKQEMFSAALQSERNNGSGVHQAISGEESAFSLADPTPNLLCFPNPNSGQWIIAFRSTKDTNAKIVVQTINGEILSEQNINLMNGINRWEIDRSDWPEGVLYVSIQSEEGRFTQRVVYLK